MQAPLDTSIDQHTLWKIILDNLQSEQERVIAMESFVYAQPPRAIFERYPQLFTHVAEIYSAKRNLFEHLKHCYELQSLHQE